VKSVSQTTGLRYWMLRVLEECDNVGASFSADPVHDLRVSLRRCRSMADGMMAMDPDPDWKAMKKAGKALFQRLGALRDVQIMMDWIDKLEPKVEKAGVEKAGLENSSVVRALPSAGSGQALPASDQEHIVLADRELYAKPPAPPDPHAARDSAAHALLGILRHRETEQKREARAALEEFDRKQWRQWSKTLPHRAAHIRPGNMVFKHLALERWTAARDLHIRAMRNRSQVALHATRIGLKRFRYIVENFLPAEHKLWSNDLKGMQDLLGEVHDLDVLWATALSSRIFSDADSRRRWHACIVKERTKRIEAYRRKMAGPDSLWNVWRTALPQGKQIQQIATRRMKLWAKVLDPDFAHSERVAHLSLELYDGLTRAGLLGLPGSQNAPAIGSNGSDSDARPSLYAAALLHDVGKSKGNKGHNKESLSLIKKHGVPLGWSEKEMQHAAIVARFHCGALPRRGHKALRDLLPNEQKSVIGLSAILRLANALDAAHDGHIRRIKIENAIPPSRRTNGFLRKPPALGKNEAVVIEAEGYVPASPTAQTIAAERYLLETVLRRPVVVKPMRVLAKS
jgi:CHAD domain-containing protein